ncbi:hypothetical protein PENSPDRAFT_618405 [Peniophora sp. CONT]|nr:hypothetical protein PENSPDRAFT_618405 [Peniophora sp. CONT]
MAPKSKAKPVERNRSTLTLDDAPPPAKKAKLSSVTKPPVFSLSASQSRPSTQSPRSTPTSTASQRASGLRLSSADNFIDLTKDDEVVQPKSKGKGKEKVTKQAPVVREQDDRLWVERYAPTTETELAVHKRKVEDVRRWLGEAFSNQPLAKYRRFLVLSGPAGSAKTATLQVLAREMGFAVNEWVPASAEYTTFDEHDFDNIYESAMDKFEAFLGRAGHYTSLFSTDPTSSAPTSSASSKPTLSGAGRSVVLLEDLPNILHPSTRARFHTAIQKHAMSSSVPVIVIVSDAGVRGEAEEPGTSSSRWTRATADDTVSSRTIIPPGLGAAHVTEIGFNPVAPTYLTSALKKMRERAGAQKLVTDTALANIVTGASGDVRAGVMALEFACSRAKGAGKRSRDASGGTDIEATTRRENALVLFHLLGKVLYNKRKGDQPPTSATKRDIAALREIDARLKDEPPLPEWLNKREARMTSRVDVDDLYANTPIDASLFGLYVHQNYTAFCTDVDQCDALVESLSWLDANGGDNWYEQNPYSFHLNALGTLHALPTPVPRTGQKFCKPAFFGTGKRETEAVAAVEKVRTWIADGSPTAASPWTRTTVALELGGVLRASCLRPPREHRLFSELVFGDGDGGDVAEEADERETGRDVDAMDEDEKLVRRDMWGDEEVEGTIVEGDDVEEF